MNQKSTEMTGVTRRQALQVLGAGVIAPTVLAACQQQEAKAPAEMEKAAKKKEKAAEKKEKAGSATKKAEPKEEKTAAASGEKEMAAKAEGGEINCNDPSYYDAQSAQMRKTLQYVEKSNKEGKQCNNCMQWKAPETVSWDEAPSACGGCKLFAGPVNPKGYCLSYAPMQG